MTRREKRHRNTQHTQGFWYIKKRNGEIVSFDAGKITVALLKAGTATGEFGKRRARQLAIQVVEQAQMILQRKVPGVEDIQDVVEDVLLDSPFKRAARAYILYRDQHARNRQIREGIDLDMVDRYVQRLDWRIQESSNESYSLQGLHNSISNEASRKYWLNRIYTPEVREAHVSGDCHIHDLGYLSVYCVGWDLQDLLQSGLHGGPAKVESGPARHFRTALGQIVNFFYTLQGEAAGAQAFANFDTLLAPFIRYDGLSYDEVKQSLQEFVFNLNVPTRVGFQTPFTNLTFDLVPHPILARQNVIVGGTVRDETYGDFQAELSMLNLAFLEVLLHGDARGRVFTFPIPTYNVTPDFDWESPAVTRLCEVVAKFGSPYFANFVNSEMSPEDFRAMCCNPGIRGLESMHTSARASSPVRIQPEEPTVCYGG